MAKPITKALHTARVFSVLALVVRHNAGGTGQHSGTYMRAADVYEGVLELLGNADTTDATLRAALIEACRNGGQS